MPEGPECTRVARQLDRHCPGKKLVNVNIISGRYTKNLPVGFDLFTPATVVMVAVKGKFQTSMRELDFILMMTLVYTIVTSETLVH